MTIKTSQREAALGALFTLLDGLSLQPSAIRRNSSLPERLSEHAMVFLRDGDMTQVDVTLSPVTYLWEHAASIEIYVAHPEASARDARMDELLQALGILVLTDPTLSGQIDHTEVMPPKFEDVTPEGSVGIKACTLDVVMHYASSHPLA